jgi:predicted DNA-binding transcriptional regulator AlpA
MSIKTLHNLPLTLDVMGVAHQLGVSRAKVYEMADGDLPAGYRLGKGRRWVTEEVVAWVVAGCPSRDDWDFTPTIPSGIPAFLDKKLIRYHLGISASTVELYGGALASFPT